MTTQNEQKNSEKQSDKIWELIKKGGKVKDHPGSDSVVIYDRMDVKVEESGLGHVNHEILTKVLTEKGAKDYCNLRFDFDPNTSFVDVVLVEIYKKNGEVYQVPFKDFIKTVPQPEHMLYWGHMMKVLSLPRMEEGDAILYKTYRKGFNIAYLGAQEDESKYIPPMYGHYYDIITFEDYLPIVEKTYSISLPKNKPFHYEIYNGELKTSIHFDDKYVTLKGEKNNLKALKKEERNSNISEFATTLILATIPNWQERSIWFWKANERMFDFNEDIAKKAKEIIKGLKTDEEIFLKLTIWVAQFIRYSGYSVAGAKEGYTLHSGIMTFRERCGVCKDIASMLVTMLRAVGYESYPASTRAGSRTEDITADQFNHCVVAVRHSDGTYTMMDPTWAFYSRELWCSAEAEQQYLIGSPYGETLMEIPARPPERSPLFVKNTVEVKPDGSIEGEITCTGTGRGDTNLRRAYGSINKAKYRGYEELLLSPIADDIEIIESYHSDIDDFSKDMELKFKYRVSDYAISDGKKMYLPSPLSRFLNNYPLCRHLEVAKLDERKNPAFLYYTHKLQCEETITLPEGYTLVTTPKVNKVDHEIIAFDYEWKADGRQVQIKESIIFKNRRVPAESYPKYKEAADALKELSKKKMVLERK